MKLKGFIMKEKARFSECGRKSAPQEGFGHTGVAKICHPSSPETILKLLEATVMVSMQLNFYIAASVEEFIFH